jgi:hypothetical protein
VQNHCSPSRGLKEVRSGGGERRENGLSGYRIIIFGEKLGRWVENGACIRCYVGREKEKVVMHEMGLFDWILYTVVSGTDQDARDARKPRHNLEWWRVPRW